MLLLVMMLVGTILLGSLSNAAVIEEVDYEARNYYDGDYNDDYDVPSALTANDVSDDYVTTGA